eukprot:4830467-Prymnesium_polylepis.1
MAARTRRGRPAAWAVDERADRRGRPITEGRTSARTMSVARPQARTPACIWSQTKWPWALSASLIPAPAQPRCHSRRMKSAMRRAGSSSKMATGGTRAAQKSASRAKQALVPLMAEPSGPAARFSASAARARAASADSEAEEPGAAPSRMRRMRGIGRRAAKWRRYRFCLAASASPESPELLALAVGRAVASRRPRSVDGGARYASAASSPEPSS